MKMIKTIRNIASNLYFLVFLIGFLTALFIFFRVQDDYENRIFHSVSKSILNNSESMPQDSLIVRTLHTTYHLLHRRSIIFKDEPTGGIVDDYIHPLTSDLLTADGACGSYASILCGNLHYQGLEIRFAQMKVNGKFGGHILSEVKSNDGWVVLDPYYNLFFKRPDGKLASFKDVSAHWQWYKNQVPVNYNNDYKYEGVRYTNWDKIPYLMPAMKRFLLVFMNKDKVDQICLRSYFLKKYQVCSNFLLMLIIPLSFRVIFKFLRLKKPHIAISLQQLQNPVLQIKQQQQAV